MTTNAVEWVARGARRHGLKPGDAPAGAIEDAELAGRWHGAWFSPAMSLGFVTPSPFELELVVDAEGRLRGRGRDLGMMGSSFRVEGNLESAGPGAHSRRFELTKTYDGSGTRLSYVAVFSGSAACGHFRDLQLPIHRGTFAMVRGEAHRTGRGLVVPWELSARIVPLVVFMGVIAGFDHLQLPHGLPVALVAVLFVLGLGLVRGVRIHARSAAEMQVVHPSASVQ